MKLVTTATPSEVNQAPILLRGPEGRRTPIDRLSGLHVADSRGETSTPLAAPKESVSRAGNWPAG